MRHALLASLSLPRSTSSRCARAALIALAFVLHACSQSTSAEPIHLDAGPLDASVVAPLCGPGTVKCGTVCVDTAHDPEHCGGCDNGCALSDVCWAGACRFECAGGATPCGRTCADLSHDPGNCGACGRACSPGQTCSNGTCALVCVGGSDMCADACVDLRNDPRNCGVCGRSCAISSVCWNGACVPLGGPSDGGVSNPCGSGVACGSSCVDITTDRANCGDCFRSCRADQVCASGACACTADESACSGACVDTDVDAKNCGACGVGCGTNEACASGECACRAGTTACGVHCVDTSIDSTNCGVCGRTCSAGDVCTEGSCAPSTSDWQTFGYDAAHTGVNASETGHPPMIAEWSATFGVTPFELNPAVVEDGRVFVTTKEYFSTGQMVHAVNVSDGAPLWSYNFGSVSSIGHPAVVDGVVYVQQAPGTSSNAHLFALDATNGDVKWSSPFGAQWEHYWAPTVAAGRVYVNAGTYGGLYGFATSDGTEVFFNSELAQYDGWSPAFANGTLYSFVQGVFRAHDAATGATLWSLTLAWNWNGYTMNTAAVFGSKYAYVISPPNLVAIDPSTKQAAWTSNGSYAGTPAVFGNTVYAVSGGNLLARNATTGVLDFVFVGDLTLSYPPVVANGYVYVSSTTHTYAVDMATHQSVWSAPVGGWLTLASRRLLVASPDGVLHGFVLSQ